MLWNDLLESMSKFQDESGNNPCFWTDGESIMCETEIQANVLADFFEDCGFGVVKTGYYDPKEDRLNCDLDEYTGYWYVTID